jgi:hypothetical protein
VFGWRQVVSGLALVAVVLGLLPVIAGAQNGQWGLPNGGVAQSLAFLGSPAGGGAYRTLWLGDPRALPVGGWSVAPGLSYALTDEEVPDSTDVWTPAGPGPADVASQAVRLAMAGGTIHLGQLLAAQGVRYIVVVGGLAPLETGLAKSVEAPPPPRLEESLLDQNDLQIVQGVFGVDVFKNERAISLTAQRSRALPSRAAITWPGPQDVVGWKPVLSELVHHPAATGSVSSGTVYAGFAPAGSFALTEHGHTVEPRRAFGWAGQYEVVSAGTATLALHRFPDVPLAVLAELLGWLVLAGALLGWPRRRRRRRPDVRRPDVRRPDVRRPDVMEP